MSNDITGQYFDHQDFSPHLDAARLAICRATGFVIETEIFRGLILEAGKLGSVIYRGQYRGSLAVLKIQGLRPEVEESWMIEQFTAQNTSLIVRPPVILLAQPWSAERGYGYVIMEHVAGAPIFQMPGTTATERVLFGRFYQSYRQEAIMKPWLPVTTDTVTFLQHRLALWEKLCAHRGRLTSADTDPYVARFRSLIDRYAREMPMVFSHGHLTANDIFLQSNQTFLMMSNLFWSYRPQWYDLAFNVWACIEHIRDENVDATMFRSEIGNWQTVYEQLPVVQRDQDFHRHFAFAMLERMMGGILVDCGARVHDEDQWQGPWFRKFLRAHHGVFTALADECEKA